MKHLRSLIEKVGKGQHGFTLIELLIVILILGIIAAVVILNVGGFLGTGEKEAFCTEGDTIQAAAMAYAVDHNGTCSNITSGELLANATNGHGQKYLVRVPKYNWVIDPNTCVCTGNATQLGPGGGTNPADYPADCG